MGTTARTGIAGARRHPRDRIDDARRSGARDAPAARLSADPGGCGPCQVRARRGSGWSRRSSTAFAAASGWTSGVGAAAWTVALGRGVVRRGTDRRPGRGRHGRRTTLDRVHRRHGGWLLGRASRRRPTSSATRPSSPAAPTLYEFRVGRADRADLGVWRRVAGDRTAERVLPPLGADAAFGRTWLTELGWSTDGRRLTVSSCAEVACRVRVLDLDDGSVRAVADPPARARSWVWSMTRSSSAAPVAGSPAPSSGSTCRRAALRCSTTAAGAVELRRDADGRPVVVMDRPDGRGPLAVDPVDGEATSGEPRP